MAETADVVVVGAGIVGASIAFHLAERGVDVLVVDRDGPVAGSTARSGGIVSCFDNTAVEAELAWESLTGYFERWHERVGGGCGFTRTGSAILAGAADAEALRAVTAVQAAGGIDVRLMSANELAAVEPHAHLDDVHTASYQPRGGYADPAAATLGFLRAGVRRFARRRVTAVRHTGGRVTGVSTPDGDIACGAVVLAAGAWSVPLAASAGAELPVRPSRIQVMLYERPYAIPMHLTMGDLINDLYLRSTADRCSLAGRDAPVREWLDDPDDYRRELDDAAVADVHARLARRFPALAERPYRLGRTAVLDMTADGKSILGPLGPEGLFTAVGWSGSGFGKAPAVGAELARWVVDGAPRRADLKRFGVHRFAEGALIHGEGTYAATTQRLGG